MIDGLTAAVGGNAHVTNLRNLGLIAGLTLVRDAESGEAYDAAEGIGGKVARHMREEGSVITRFVGDQIVLAPPLIVNGDEVDQVVGAVEAAINAVTG